VATEVSFRVGIVRPDAPLELACVVELRGALAMSGTYERGAHLFSPRSGRFETALASASVCGPDLGFADALATALAVGGDEVLAAIESLEDYEALVIGAGERRSTRSFPVAAPSTPSSRAARTLEP
jgi:thiamine biosynthesis lipoprotein